MKFETLEDYDNELSSMKKSLDEMETYIKEHPERLGYAGNYKTLKYVYNIYKQNKQEFIEELSNINLNLKGNLVNNGLTISDLAKLSNKFNETENTTINSLYEKSNEDLIVKSITAGSYNIIFAFENPTEEDVKRISPRKKGLIKIFNFIKCGENIDKLKKKAGPNGKNALIKYKEFLNEITKHEADFSLDTENGNLKASLTLEEIKIIHNNLKI